ncbi:class I SAM-dependent methyltransferase [Blastococcus sp. PRF04-17]|uniref:class I SAM-dependent methyltransferase n=1 Tax=Blastococcus sp. PRF04-17 TaxID=2933797 RepID=UPI001FF541B4|nr:class I SAM-dependent methyltransferase [Blastococcus sp. PRF04-17]UOY03320.1 class I SAM-dependent methyltransferase [Blastococcus sp. PRF04-17]
MSDSYQDMGELHDLFVEDAWARLRPALTQAFGQLDGSAVVLDVGAGTGVRTRVTVLAGQVPEALDAMRGPIAGFVCAHVLGHLPPRDRRATFAGLARLLGPSGVGS